jgi:hypothetical protein
VAGGKGIEQNNPPKETPRNIYADVLSKGNDTNIPIFSLNN